MTRSLPNRLARLTKTTEDEVGALRTARRLARTDGWPMGESYPLLLGLRRALRRLRGRYPAMLLDAFADLAPLDRRIEIAEREGVDCSQFLGDFRQAIRDELRDQERRAANRHVKEG